VREKKLKYGSLIGCVSLLVMPPSNTSLIKVYSVYMVIICAVLLYLIVGNKVARQDLWVIMILFLFSLFTLLYLGKIMVLRYVVGGGFLYFLLRRYNKVITLSDLELFLFLLIPAILMLGTLKYTHYPERYSIFVGDPNYTFIAYFSVLIIIIEKGSNFLLKIIALFLLVYVLYATGSRMGMIMTGVYVMHWWKWAGKYMDSKKIALMILLLSVIVQPIWATRIKTSRSTAVIKRELEVVGLNDSSNIKRLLATQHSMEFLKSDPEKVIFGSSNYINESNVSSIPHHMFLMISVNYGLLFAIILFCLIFYSISVADPKNLYIVSIYILSSGILGAYPVIVALPVLLTVIKND